MQVFFFTILNGLLDILGFVLVWFSFFLCMQIYSQNEEEEEYNSKNTALYCACLCACMYACTSMCMCVSVHVLAYMCILGEHMIPNPNVGYCPRSSCKTFHPPSKAITVTELLAY